MPKTTKMNMRRSRRGVTIVETAIALALIMIISGATLSLILSGVDVETKSLTTIEAGAAAENVLECFRFAQSGDEFFEALQKLDAYEQTESSAFVLHSRYFTATVHANFDSDHLFFVAVDKEGTRLFSYSYPKAAHNTALDVSVFTDPTSKNNHDLVAYATDAYYKNWGYVWGTYGQILTQTQLDAKISRYPLQVGGKAEYIRQNWLGGRTTDCIGLIKSYFWLNPTNQEIEYESNAMSDISANQLFESVSDPNKGAIGSIPEVPGLAVWHDGHVGIYIGDGKVIHSMSTEKGVVCTTLGEYSLWTHWMYIPGLTYNATPVAAQ